MAISLEKRKPISLTKARPGLQKVLVGLGWDEAVIGGIPVDCDVSLFMLGANGKIPTDDFFIFYNNLKSPDGSVVHLGDSLGGVGEGDDETISVDLSRVDPRVNFLYFAVTIHESSQRGHHFGNVAHAYIKVRNAADNSVLCEYQLNESFANQDSLVIASISKSGDEWNIEALGQPFSGGLAALVELYQ